MTINDQGSDQLFIERHGPATENRLKRSDKMLAKIATAISNNLFPVFLVAILGSLPEGRAVEHIQAGPLAQAPAQIPSNSAPSTPSQSNGCLGDPSTPATTPCLTKSKNILKGKILFVEGVIDKSLYDFFNEILTRDGNFAVFEKIEFNTNGGDLSSEFFYVYQVAEWIRGANIATNVREGAVCLDTCTILFQAGTGRSAHKDAIFRMQSPRNPELKATFDKACLGQTFPEGDPRIAMCDALKAAWESSCENQTIAWLSYVISMDADPKIFSIYQMQSKDPDWISSGNCNGYLPWTFSALDAKEFNIVQQVFPMSSIQTAK